MLTRIILLKHALTKSEICGSSVESIAKLPSLKFETSTVSSPALYDMLTGIPGSSSDVLLRNCKDDFLLWYANQQTIYMSTKYIMSMKEHNGIS